MGFFDEIAGKAMEKVRGANGDQVSGASGGILEILRAQPGGLSGLVQNFHDKGLGAIVSSWISNGQNLPISAEQIQGVLGNEQVKQFAAKAGLSPAVASSKLAELLPTIVDKLTPNGKLPEEGGLLQQLLSKK